MATAAYLGDIDISDDDATYNALNGCNNISFSPSRAMLEITDFEDTAVNRISGLNDASVTLSGHRVQGDTALGQLTTGLTGGADIYVRWLVDGTNGYKLQGKVESLEFSASVDGTVEFSATVQGVATFTTV